MRDPMYQTSSVSQITPTCPHPFFEIKIQSINLWTTNLCKWTKISLKKKMDSKHHRVCRNLQHRQLQWEQEEAQGLAQDQPQGDLHQAMIWPMLDLIYEWPGFMKPAGCKISTQMNKHFSRRPSTATSTPNYQSFKNKDAHTDPTQRDS